MSYCDMMEDIWPKIKNAAETQDEVDEIEEWEEWWSTRKETT